MASNISCNSVARVGLRFTTAFEELRANCARAIDALASVKRRVEGEIEILRTLRSIDEDPGFGSYRAHFIGAAAWVLGEASVNQLQFILHVDGGLIEAIALSSGLSILNVGGGAVLGRICFNALRPENVVPQWKRNAAKLADAILVVLMIVSNFLFAYAVDEGSTDILKSILQNFGIPTSLQSWLLLAFGLLIATVSTYKFHRLDPIPDFRRLVLAACRTEVRENGCGRIAMWRGHGIERLS